MRVPRVCRHCVWVDYTHVQIPCALGLHTCVPPLFQAVFHRVSPTRLFLLLGFSHKTPLVALCLGEVLLGGYQVGAVLRR